MAVFRVPQWLWLVADLEGETRPVSGRGWLRCQALTVREELPTWLVLGAYGEAVVGVTHQAQQLTAQQAKTIAALDPSDKLRLVSHVWDSWLSPGRGGSPVGIGLVEVDHAITQAARGRRVIS
jgi:hypothetical protein